MEEVCDRCVVLKGLPINCTKHTVNEVLDLAHGDFRFKDKYEKLSTYQHTEDEVRWIVLFKSAQDAALCIQSGKWLCNTDVGRHEVAPDLCSDCIIPDDWILTKDWVVTASLAENDRLSTNLSSGGIDDSFVAIGNEMSRDSASISGDRGSSDESTGCLQGAACSINVSTASDYHSTVPKTRSKYLEKQTPCTNLPDLIQTKYMFGSGQEECTSPIQSLGSSGDLFGNDTKLHSNKESDENTHIDSNKTPDECDIEEENHEPAKHGLISPVSSYEMFGSGSVRQQVDNETMLQEGNDEKNSEHRQKLSDEAVVSMDTQEAERINSNSASRLGPSTAICIDVEEPDFHNIDDSAAADNNNRNNVKQNINQNDTHEHIQQTYEIENTEKNDAIEHTKQTAVNENTGENDANENMEQSDAFKNKEQNNTKEQLRHKNSTGNVERINTHVNKTGVNFDPRMTKNGNKVDEGATGYVHEATYQDYAYGFPPMGMPIPMPGQHYPYRMPMPMPMPMPYMPYMMRPSPAGKDSKTNTENAPSDAIDPEYFYSYMPYQIPPMRHPMYENQQAYQMRMPYPAQAYPLLGVQKPIVRPNLETDQRLQEGMAETAEHIPIYDEVKPGVRPIYDSPTSVLYQQLNNANIQSRHSEGSGLTDMRQSGKGPIPAIRKRPKTDGNIKPPMDKENNAHLEHFQRQQSGDSDNNRTQNRLSSNSMEDYEDNEEMDTTSMNKDYESVSTTYGSIDEHLYEEIDRSIDRTTSDDTSPKTERKRPPIPAPRKTLQNREETDTDKVEKRRSALPVYDSSGTDERQTVRKTVLVKGLTETISEEILELFFENNARSGGGEIQDIKINAKKKEAMISFCNENDAATVLKRARSGGPLTLSDVELEVCEYVPSLLNPLMLLMTNINETTSEECIRNFVEAKIHTEAEHIVFGETPGTAMLYFNSAPDVLALQQCCKVRPCDGAYLNVLTVEKSKSIRVTDFNDSTSTEALGLYFENKRRSKGGDVEEVRSRQNLDGETEYVVTFVKYEDAERVCDNQNHSLDGRKLTVCLHYPCMELDEDAIPIIPKPVTFDEVDKYILKFIRLSKYYHGLLEDNITEIHGKVVWNEFDECLVIECIVDSRDRGARLKLKNWTDCCDRIVKTMFDEIVIKESKRVACEVFDELKIRLLSIDVSNPDKVSVFLDKDECYIIMVGSSDLVETLVVRIKTLVEETERTIYDDNQVITKKRKLFAYQMALLRATRQDEKLKASISVLEIDYPNRECIFKGRQKDVDNGLEELNKSLQSFISKPVTDFPKQATELTFQKEARDYVKSKFYKDKLIGVWQTTRSKEVYMNGRSEKEVNKATDIFLKSFVVTVLSLDSSQATILNSHEGQVMISDIERKHEGIVQVLADVPKLTVVSIDKIHDEVKAEIEKLFDVHTIVKEFLPTQPGRLEFVKKFQRADLKTIEEQYQRLKVQITIADVKKKSGFHVTGKKDGCKLALNKLQKVLDAVQCNIITKSWPGLDVYLSTEEGTSCIQQIEVKEKCVVKVMAEKIKDDGSSVDKGAGARHSSEGATECAASKITIQVVTGSLVDENVDVVVNSTNKDIDLTVGMVARTLLKAGGDKLEAECKKKYPNGINVGDLALTMASGSLKCHALFHGLLVKWDNGQGYSQLVMEQFIDKCLTKADRSGCLSIAFPALGTGALKFPADVVAKTMFSSVKTFETTHPNTSIKDVHFVVWEGDQPTVKAFQREYSTPSSTGNRRSSRNSYIQPDARSNVFDSSSGYTTSVDRVAVSVTQGDLTKAKTGAIVNSTIDQLDLNSGNISKAILHAAGSSIQLEANTKKMAFLDEGMVVTKPGKLYCQRIIHVRARNSEKGWLDTIVKTLETAEMLGLSSVAFPALGTGGKGAQPETMAKLMIQALQKFKSKTTGLGCLKSIQIIVYESSMVEKFVKGIKDTIEPSTKRFSLKFWQNKSEPTAKVILHVYAESGYVLEQVATKLDEIRQQETIMFSARAAESLDDTKSKELLALKQIYGVDVEISHGRVMITGFGRDANRAVNLAKKYVNKIEADVKNSVTESTVTLPSLWSKMSPFELFKVLRLRTSDAEYVSIATRFAAETGCPTTNIQKIERIQNTTLYTQFISKKRQMEAKGGKNVEQKLWHGTSSAVVDMINEFGFDRNYNSGASHGAGVYFAVNASTSAQGYCRPDATGNKHIYLAYVLTGDYTVGSHGIRVPPLNPQSPGRTYDSTTDNVQAPNFFVIFHDAQAYPAFHIVFQ